MTRAWKDHEKATARRLGGKRTSLQGLSSPDVVAGRFCVECKERRQLPKWLVAALGQARNAATAGQLPIAVLHELGKRHDQDLVILTMRDFESLADGID